MSIENPGNYLYNFIEKGFPARVPIGAFVHTPAASMGVIEFVTREELVVENIEVLPGTCGSSGDTTWDLTDDGTSIMASTPTIENTDTDGTRQTFYPDATKRTIAAGSAVKLAFGTAATGAANFGFVINAVTRCKMP